MLDHKFGGTPFTVGIEEELMICDAETLELAQAIETILGDLPEDVPGEVKPELMQSVLEVATLPCANIGEAADQLRQLRRCVREVADRNGLVIGAAGTHPSAHYEDQLIVDQPRYKQLAAELKWIAEQELIFGAHVHVGIDDAEKAIFIADSMRGYLPLLLGMSSNSPLWQGKTTGMMSSRTPVFRAFPRVGIPPYYGNWETYSNRVEQMMRGGAIPDYTYLWWDVRPHPNLGTVELRVFDQQTRVDLTIGFAAFAQALAHRLSGLYEEGVPSVDYPHELIDDNKIRAALVGIEGDLIDFDQGLEVLGEEMTLGLIEDLRDDARALGCEDELAALTEVVESGTGARRQLNWLQDHGDVGGLMKEIVAATDPDA
ncbi:MAG TPA: YbdK family carboxylate-amine ligase [Solirubrobacterales bacterium]|nr:YbdK family carboxylate-amine ligase [Solirubrobacterales bacterium]